MVTKPTGRLPGRPKKQTAPKVKRPSRGQPRKPLTAWPNRYEYDFAEGFMKYQAEIQGISRDRSAVAATMLFFGEIELTPANTAAAMRGDSFAVRTRPGCYREGATSGEWRDKDAWHLHAADVMRAGELKYWRRQIKPVMLLCAGLFQEDRPSLKVAQQFGTRRSNIDGRRRNFQAQK